METRVVQIFQVLAQLATVNSVNRLIQIGTNCGAHIMKGRSDMSGSQKPQQQQLSEQQKQNTEIERIFGGARGNTRKYKRIDCDFTIDIEKSRESEFRAYLRQIKATDAFLIA